jgi:hypothetical protein
MGTRTQFILSLIVIVLMAAASVWAFTVLPQLTQIPVHWNLAGEAVAFRSKEVLLIGTPAIAALLTLVFAVMTRGNGDISGKMLRAVWAGGVLSLAAVHVFFVLSAAGMVHAFGNYTALFPAVFLAVIGNYLSKRGSGDEQGTGSFSHGPARRWMGRLLVLTGIATAATWALVPGPTSELVLIAGGLGSALVGTIIGATQRRSPEQNGA